jgi:Flp pilus assembly protein TadG
MIRGRHGARSTHSTDRARRRLAARVGSVAVEYAIVLPALLMFLLGLVDAGRLLWTNTTLARAVAAASRCAAVNPIDCGTASAVQSYAAGQAWGLGLAASAFTVSVATCGMRVHGTVAFGFVTPWFYIAAPFGASNTLTLSATACYPT